MKIQRLSEGRIAWFEPETEEDKKILEQAKRESWTEAEVLKNLDFYYETRP